MKTYVEVMVSSDGELASVITDRLFDMGLSSIPFWEAAIERGL